MRDKSAWSLYIEVELGDIQPRTIDPEIELLDSILGGGEKQVAWKAP
jgi:hypothetical protein